jgi:hypothetical protein
MYAHLNQAGQAAARQIFTQLVHLAERAEATRRVALKNELGETNWEVVECLAGARLVVIGQNIARNETVEVVHEVLIHKWERLRGWLEADRAFRAWQERLRAALRQWRATGQGDGGLLRGALLAEAEGWRQSHHHQLGEAEQTFIEASLAFREQRRQEAEAQRQRELAQTEQWAREQRRRADEQVQAAASLRQRVGWTTAISIVMILLALAVIWQLVVAQQERALATSRELAANAQINLRVDPDLSALLALQAIAAADTHQAWTVLRQAVQELKLQMTLTGHEDWVSSISLSPDGTRLATASLDQTVKV